MIRFLILQCFFLILLLVTHENQFVEDEEQLEHIKETQGVHWFASNAHHSNEARRSNETTSKDGYTRKLTQSFNVQSFL